MSSDDRTQAATKWALLIGIDLYEKGGSPLIDTHGHEMEYSSLHGCVWDIHNMEYHLVCKMGVPKTNIRKLTTEPQHLWMFKGVEATRDGQPTYANIVGGLDWVLQNARSGDLVYLHYSGHGGQATTVYPELKGKDAIDECLLPSDFGKSAGKALLRDIELAIYIKRMVEQGIVLTVVMDCCHSGSITRAARKENARQVERIYKSLESDERTAHTTLVELGFNPDRSRQIYSGDRVSEPWLLECQGYTLLAACRPRELALEPHQSDGFQSGNLSYWLLDALKSKPPNLPLSAKMLYQRLGPKIRHASEGSQNPLIGGRVDREFFGPLESITHTPAITVCSVSGDRKSLTLDAGSIHGVVGMAEYIIYSQTSEVALVEVKVSKVSPSTANAHIRKTLTSTEQVDTGCKAVLYYVPPEDRFVVLLPKGPQQHDDLENAWNEIREEERPEFQLERQVFDSNFMFRLTIHDSNVNVEIKGITHIKPPPPVPFNDRQSVEKLIYRLRHLASYQVMKALNSNDAASPLRSALSLNILGKCKDEKDLKDPSTWRPVQYVDGMFVTPHGSGLVLQVKNLSDKILDFSIFDINPSFGITKYYPKNSVAESLDPNAERLMYLRFTVPEVFHDMQSILDTVKVFLTPRYTSLDIFTLEDLLKVERSDTRGGKNPLDSLNNLLKRLRRPARQFDDGPTTVIQEWGAEELTVRTLFLEREGSDNKEESYCHWRMALQHHDNYKEARKDADLLQAIKCGDKSTKSNQPYDQAINLSTLSEWWNEKYDSKSTSEPEDIDAGISCCELAIRLSLETHHNYPKILNSLALRLLARFKATGSEKDLEDSIAHGSKALESVMKEHAFFRRHPHAILVIQAQIEIRNQEFLRFSKLNALTHIIDLYKLLVNETTESDKYRPGRLSNLAGKLGERYKRSQEYRDLQECIENDETAVTAMERLEKQRVAMAPGTKGNILNRYSLHLSWKFERYGSKTDLCNSLKLAQDAVNAAEENLQKAVLLGNLANRLLTKYEVYGSVESLDEAVCQACEALNLINQVESESKGDHARILNTLGNVLIAKHEQSHEEYRLNEAIDHFQKAVKLEPLEPFVKALTQSGLASGLFHRYERTGDVNDLDDAIKLNEALVPVVNDPTGKAKVLNNLANQYQSRFKHTRSCGDVEKATNRGRDALDASTSTYDRMIHHINLANHYEVKFDAFRDQADINEAVTEAEKSKKLLDEIPETPLNARIVYLYALKLRKQPKASDGRASSDLANQILRKALESSHSPSRDKIQCALLRANILMEKDNDEEVYAICQTIMDLIPSLVASSSCQKDQQDELVEFEGVARKAAAIAVDKNKGPVNALRLLQAGRGVIANHLLESRGNSKLWIHDFLSAPGECHTPETQAQLCMPSNRNFEEDESTPQASNHKRYLSCGLRHFLDNNPSGTIVLINVSFRCDAFLLNKNGLDHVHLSELYEKDVIERASLLAPGSPGKSEMLNILKWLWDSVSCPILERLGHSNQVVHSLPRIWWIPTGRLAHLPIHAAGDYASNNSVLGRVLSSYSPTIKSLLFAHVSRMSNAVSQENPPESKAVVVYMADTPGKRPLIHAESEAQAVYNILPEPDKTLLAKPLKETVLQSLEGCTIFHFAGHGEADKSDPSKSRLILSDGPISVLDFLRKVPANPAHAFLSYLSACSSGSSVVDGLDEEGIHVMGAFLLAGFRHVIGSLWPVSDKDCVDVAKAVYSHIVTENLTDDSVSMALHRAIHLLSGLGGLEQAVDRPQVNGAGPLAENPYIWAAFIHMGV